MGIEYTLTEDDFLKLRLHGQDVVPAFKWRYRMFRWIVPIGGIIYAAGMTAAIPAGSPDKGIGIGFIGMTVALLLGAPKLFEVLERMNVRTLMRARENSFLNGPYRLLLLPEELHFTTAASHNGYKWSGIQNVTEIPTHYFFWVSAQVALIVPKRAFQTPEQQREFEQTFQRYRPTPSLLR